MLLPVTATDYSSNVLRLASGGEQPDFGDEFDSGMENSVSVHSTLKRSEDNT
jgi:hypothetical protein